MVSRCPPRRVCSRSATAFRRSVVSYADANHIPVLRLKSTDRNIDVMRRYLGFRLPGKGVRRSRRSGSRRNRSGCSSPANATPTRPSRRSFPSTRRTAGVTVYYFYLWDTDFGPAFIKVCSYCPWPIKVWLNGHEWAKRQATQSRSAIH